MITLAVDLLSGRFVNRISNAGLDVPTTVADLGNRLYAVNARFGTPATPTTSTGSHNSGNNAFTASLRTGAPAATRVRAGASVV